MPPSLVFCQKCVDVCACTFSPGVEGVFVVPTRVAIRSANHQVYRITTGGAWKYRPVHMVDMMQGKYDLVLVRTHANCVGILLLEGYLSC